MAKRRISRSLTQCPNCGSIWGVGSEEWDWQQCDACGWPDNENDRDDYNDYDEDEFDEDYDDEINDPNDSRNL